MINPRYLYGCVQGARPLSVNCDATFTLPYLSYSLTATEAIIALPAVHLRNTPRLSPETRLRT